MNISFFCTAYMDEDNLEYVITDAIRVLKPIADNLEILVIEDKSPDRTGEVADRLAKKYDCVKAIHHKENIGCGASIKTGLQMAKNELIFYTDGDNQYDINDMNKLLPYIDEYDIIMGVRVKRADSLRRKIQSKVYNFLVNLIYGVNFKDVNCSFKIIKKRLLDQINIESRSGFIHAEVLIKCLKLGAKVKEIPINHRYREYGSGGGGSAIVILKTFLEIFKFRSKI